MLESSVASRSEPASPVDYLAIGHITRTYPLTGYQAGGTVLYSGRLATALGMRVGVVTSTVPDFDLERALPAMTVVNIPAAHATTFENILHTVWSSSNHPFSCRATDQILHIPDAWRNGDHPPGATRRKIDETTVTACRGTFIGLTAQD